MQKKEIGSILRVMRNTANMQTSDVVIALKKRGITLSEKTLYGYENGQSSPQISTLFELCSIYGITDIGSAFGLNNGCEITPLTLDYDKQVQELFLAFRSLNDIAREKILVYANDLISTGRYFESNGDDLA